MNMTQRIEALARPAQVAEQETKEALAEASLEAADEWFKLWRALEQAKQELEAR